MHGSSFAGDAAPVLGRLAEFYEGLLQQATTAPRG
jgi:hypothetical protein